MAQWQLCLVRMWPPGGGAGALLKGGCLPLLRAEITGAARSPLAPRGPGNGVDRLAVLSEPRDTGSRCGGGTQQTAFSYVGHCKPTSNQIRGKNFFFFNFPICEVPQTMTNHLPCRKSTPPFSVTPICLPWDLSSPSPSHLTVFFFLMKSHHLSDLPTHW